MPYNDSSRINTSFDAILCINLDRRPARMEKACEQFANVGIENVLRFSAIDGSKLDYRTALNAGQLGCTLSHLFVLEYARDNNLESILIFEDDVEFAENFNEIFNQAIDELPKDWHMLYFGGNHFHGVVPHSQHLVKLKGTLTTHAIAVHSRFYHVAISTIRERLNQIIDVTYMQLHAQYPCYSIHPKITFQTAGFSDLEMREVDYSVLK